VKTIVSSATSREIRRAGDLLPEGVEFLHRDELDPVQRELREIPGVTVLIYDQTCAAEKRRAASAARIRRSDPSAPVINERVCEGCGDCGEKSNCVSVEPVETEFGPQAQHQPVDCNKDFSCVKGFCPSFVTITPHPAAPMARPRRKRALASRTLGASCRCRRQVGRHDSPLASTSWASAAPASVTVGALIGMAAHLEGKHVIGLDQTGLAQKGGAVTTHVRVARSPNDIHAVRIAAGEADLVLGCDMVVVNDYWAMSKIRAGRAHTVLNGYEAMPGTFTRNPDMQFPKLQIVDAVQTAMGGEKPDVVDATELATALLGDSIATNTFMLGYAWQKGFVPVSLDALMRAIELNGAAIELNKRAFYWGRLAAHDLASVKKAAAVRSAPAIVDFVGASQAATDAQEHLATSAAFEGFGKLAQTLDDTIALRSKFLTEYQDAAYAERYKALLAKVRAAETRLGTGNKLAETVARYAFKLMAYKDEYEVARLYTTGDFRKRIAETFDGDYTIRFNLAPPLFAKKDADGHLVKAEYGPWIFTAFKLLAKFKGLRGGALDVFGYTAERKMERQLIADYFRTVEELVGKLDAGNVGLAVQIAEVPEHIRGYGHVKEAHLATAKAKEAELLARFRNPVAVEAAKAA
jgi:indolepyruvate ferredoxin oxidoreductase